VKPARVRVIALGQPAAGDDGVGLAVLDELRAAPLPEDVELVAATDAADLVALLAGVGSAIVIDAVVGGQPGAVRELAPEDLACRAAVPVSTHGIDVQQAIELARILSEGAAPELRIVGVAVERPRRLGTGLSPSAAAAVPEAAARVRALLGA
jgi:hydrogenase maturation protease